MFATLLGPLPRPDLPADVAAEEILATVIEAQVAHGLEPITDGGWPADSDPVRSWQRTSDLANGLVKTVMAGPYSVRSDGHVERRRLEELAAAGCRWIEVHEPDAVSIGTDSDARRRFVDLHRALTDGLDGVHLSLAIVGGSADGAGIETILAGSYASLALDLVAGPDNWRLAVAAPTERGVIAGVYDPTSRTTGPELGLWAAGYAASTGGRGMDRVGLATSGSLASMSWSAAVARLRDLGEASRLVTARNEERLGAVDPRAIDARSAGLGRAEPPPVRQPRDGR